MKPGSTEGATSKFLIYSRLQDKCNTYSIFFSFLSTLSAHSPSAHIFIGVHVQGWYCLFVYLRYKICVTRCFCMVVWLSCCAVMLNNFKKRQRKHIIMKLVSSSLVVYSISIYSQTIFLPPQQDIPRANCRDRDHHLQAYCRTQLLFLVPPWLLAGILTKEKTKNALYDVEFALETTWLRHESL